MKEWEFIKEIEDQDVFPGYDISIRLHPPLWQPLFFPQWLTPRFIVKYANKGPFIKSGRIVFRYKLYPKKPKETETIDIKDSDLLGVKDFENLETGKERKFTVKFNSSQIKPEERYFVYGLAGIRTTHPEDPHEQRVIWLSQHRFRPAVIVHSMYLLVSIIAGIIIGFATVIIQIYQILNYP